MRRKRDEGGEREMKEEEKRRKEGEQARTLLKVDEASMWPESQSAAQQNLELLLQRISWPAVYLVSSFYIFISIQSHTLM